MIRAGEDRKKENKDFQQTVADQCAFQKLLRAPLNILKGFYEKKAAALLQQEPAGLPPLQASRITRRTLLQVVSWA